jgi:ABC-type dipeptide/oligopeptide/nickel transport system permease subunit
MDAIDQAHAQDNPREAPSTAAGSILAGAAARKHRTLWADAFGRMIRNRLALGGLIMVVLISLLAIFASFIAPYPYAKPDFVAINAPLGTSGHILGTDELGRDFLSRMIFGAQVSILIGIGSQIIVFFIGVPIGALAGFMAGKTDTILMRFVDVAYAFPQLLFVILIMSWRGPGLTNIFVAIGVTGWVTLARLTRAEFLTMRERDYVLAARAAGTGSWRLVTRHMLPNALTPIIVALTFGVPQAIFTEASLSFIGVGVSQPRPSWGQMVGQYFTYLQAHWYLAVLPAIAIAIVMLAFTFFGDGLRDALDPRMQRT